jgi:SM-20-related protein
MKLTLPNGFYKKHVDQFATTKDRRISCVYYLNENWQPDFGGELTLYNTQDELLTHVQPLGNRFVCFNSDMPHEVCTAYQTRYSIAAWLKVRSLSRIPAAKTAGSRG